MANDRNKRIALISLTTTALLLIFHPAKADETPTTPAIDLSQFDSNFNNAETALDKVINTPKYLKNDQPATMLPNTPDNSHFQFNLFRNGHSARVTVNDQPTIATVGDSRTYTYNFDVTVTGLPVYLFRRHNEADVGMQSITITLHPDGSVQVASSMDNGAVKLYGQPVSLGALEPNMLDYAEGLVTPEVAAARAAALAKAAKPEQHEQRPRAVAVTPKKPAKRIVVAVVAKVKPNIKHNVKHKFKPQKPSDAQPLRKLVLVSPLATPVRAIAHLPVSVASSLTETPVSAGPAYPGAHLSKNGLTINHQYTISGPSGLDKITVRNLFDKYALIVDKKGNAYSVPLDQLRSHIVSTQADPAASLLNDKPVGRLLDASSDTTNLATPVVSAQ